MGIPCKIRVVRPLGEVYPEYQPELGVVYDAEFCAIKSYKKEKKMDYTAICVIPIKDKKIVVRKGEYEMVSIGEDERSCVNCANDGLDVPHCKECPGTGFAWFREKV